MKRSRPARAGNKLFNIVKNNAPALKNVKMCVHKCNMHAHTYANTHTHTHTLTHTHTHTHTQTHIHTHIYTLFLYLSFFVSLIHTDKHIDTDTHIYTVNILIHTCNNATQREEKDIYTMIGITDIQT